MSVLEATKAKKKTAKRVQKKPVRLSDIDKETIKSDYKTNKFTLRQLAEKYNVSHVTISKICEGINKTEQSEIISRVKEDVVEKVLETNTSMTDKVAIIQAIGSELTNYAAVHDVSHAILASSKRIALKKEVESHELKDVSVAAKNAGQMLGVATCSNAPSIVNTNAVQVNAASPTMPIDEQEAARVYADFIKG